MKIADVREELQDYLSEINKSMLPNWLLEAVDSWCRAVFMGVSKFKYWDGDKQKHEEIVSVDSLKKLITPYKEFQKFVKWIERNA
jgi:hypothetical protein